MPLSDVRTHELQALVGKHQWPSSRLRNNDLIPLCGAVALACNMLLMPNVVAAVKNSKNAEKSAGPVHADERDRILEHLAERDVFRIYVLDPRKG